MSPSLDRAVAAVTLWQPWASLVARGLKTIETRSWHPFGKLGMEPDTRPAWLAIHAAQNRAHAVDVWESRELNRVVRGAFGPLWNLPPSRGGLPRGEVLCVVELVRVWRVDSEGPPELRAFCGPDGLVDSSRREIPEAERALGDFRVGRYAWELGRVLPLRRPSPSRGARGLWLWRPPEDAALAETAPFAVSIEAAKGAGSIEGRP